MTTDPASSSPTRTFMVHQFAIVSIKALLTREWTLEEGAEREAVWWSGLDSAALTLFGISVKPDDAGITPARLFSSGWSPGSGNSFPRPSADPRAGTGPATIQLVDIDILTRLGIEYDDWIVTSSLSLPEEADHAGYLFYYYHYRSLDPGDLYLHELSLGGSTVALFHLAREYEIGIPQHYTRLLSPINKWLHEAEVLAASSGRILRNITSFDHRADNPSESEAADSSVPFSVIQLPSSAFDGSGETDHELEGFEQVSIQIDDVHMSRLLIGENAHMLITRHPDEANGMRFEVMADAAANVTEPRIARVERATGPTEWLITMELALRLVWNNSIALQYLTSLGGGTLRGSG